MKFSKRDLNEKLDISALAERAENKHRKAQYGRKRLSQRVSSLIPLLTIMAWVVAYGLSAPHTATLFMLITPDIAFGVNMAMLAPLVIEGFIAIISALRAYSKNDEGDKPQYGAMLFWLMALSISINVIGGAVALEMYLANQSSSSLEVLWVVASVPAGVIVSFLSMVTGSILVRFSKGEIQLEITFDETWAGLERFNALYHTIYDEVIKIGGTPAQAEALARDHAYRLSPDISLDDNKAPYVVDARAYTVMPVTTATGVAMSHNVADVVPQELGFHRYLAVNHSDPLKPIETTNDRRDVSRNVADVASDVADYLTTPNKMEFIRGEVARRNLRGTSGEIALALFGEDTSTIRRAVQRALKDA